jgi:hypothetical protein
MNRYCFHYHSGTLASLVGRKEQQALPRSSWVFDFQKDGAKVAFIDSIMKVSGINLHTGLNMIVDVKAESVSGAREISKNFTEMLLNLITYSTLAYCSPANLVSMMEIGDKEPHRFEHYVYPFDEQELIGSLSVIDESLFGAIFQSYDRSSCPQRVMRSLFWLRKGVGEENKVDQFVSYWVGLEVIQHILRRNLATKMKNPGEWAGVEDIFTRKLHFKNFGAVKKDGRNGLLHGFRELDDKFVREIASYVEPLRKTLIFCIGSVLDLKDSNTLTISNKTPRGIPKGSWAIIKGDISDLPVTFNDLIRDYPGVDAEVTNKEFSIDENGELKLKFKTDHHFHGSSGTKWMVKSLELWGDKDAGIRHGGIG